MSVGSHNFNSDDIESRLADRYRVSGILGRGGMSVVLRAFDQRKERDVAIKVLLPSERAKHSEGTLKALEREAEALSRFSHRNVVEFYEFVNVDEMPHVVMEYVDGENLHSLMKSGALPWEDFRLIALQCLEALLAAEEIGLLHRDLKPGNIMVKMDDFGDFVVKIMDFGLSKFVQAPKEQTHDQRGIFLGTLDFIAPEQLELQPLDSRTDLYSLGCVFYYSLTQRGPFSGASPAETTRNHLEHRCRPIEQLRPDIPEEVCEWLMRMISLDPDDRPCSAETAYSQYVDSIANAESIRSKKSG